MSDTKEKKRWGLDWALLLLALAIPCAVFTAAAVIMFLNHQPWPGGVFTAFSLLTVPNVNAGTPK